ncbi:MAG: DNA-directed RNA polymerase subunit alpha [Patescibacteria group bacterium]|jgi:DNA-directed RNA polymerase subunit alpha
MKHIPLPKKFIVEESVPGKSAQIVIEPCFPGYGLTLGNALRRIILSSLPGGAVTAVKIKGVKHECSAMENVPEDVLEIILNLKTLRFKVYSDEPVTLQLKAEGKKKVTGADIQQSVDAEVVNKDAVITSLSAENAEIEMELTVAKGIGYVPVEDQNKGKGEIGTILTDSIFTPVINVGLEVEATRVGQRTDYDKLILTVETDGTISPEDAVKKAAEILTNQFSWIMEGGTREIEEIDIEAPIILPEVAAEEKVEEVLEENAEVAEGAGEESTEEPKPKKRGRPKKIEE